MDIDLDGMSLDDLRGLRTRLDRAIESYEGRRRREALTAAEQAAKQFGFNLADLTGARAGRGRRAAAAPAGAPKYAHPDDRSQTWSGR
nr:H-NS histone family protein [Paracoccus sp. (in: a-proteobacteria)]